jgi:phosphoglucomutase/phosphomannomutase
VRDVSSPGRAEWIDRAERAGKLGAAAATALRRWMGDDAFAAHQAEIGALIDREAFDELQDAFGAVIPFGTGGRRGAMGPGPNRINERTIAESAHGLATYVLRSGTKGAGGGRARIVIAYDTRRNSRAFAETAASVVAGNGMEALLFEGPRSTPELSFAVRHLGAAAGIVISASHNPPEDNGFKAYWSDGGQVVPPHDAAIIEEVVKVTTPARLPLEEAARRGLYSEIGREADGAYLDYVAGLTLGSSREVRIVFTPLHGTGTTSVAPALREAGFGDVHPLPLQWEADPDFSGVPGRSPNPENPAALDAAVKLAESIGADLVLGSDPDADRLGAVVRHGGAWEFLTGNQIGVLLFEHIARSLAASGTVPARAALLKTCVTSDLLDRIAAEHGIAVQGDYLVGFKYIAEAIGAMPDPSAFVFGIEESHGYLRGAGVRDKDAAQAAVLLAERAAELKAEGRTLKGALEAIWARHGYYVDLTRSIPLAGAGGGALGTKMMDALRASPPSAIAGEQVIAVADRRSGTIVEPGSGRAIGRTTGIAGNLLVFHLSEGGADRISVRPSGTEPKIKIYIQIRGTGSPAGQAAPGARAALDERAARLAADFAGLTRRS